MLRHTTRTSAILLFIFFVSISGFAQTFSIKGVIRDADTTVMLANASIRLSPLADSTKGKFTTAATDGKFSFANVAPGGYLLQFTFTGYQKQSRRVRVQAADVDLGEVLLVKNDKTLKDVTVVGKVPPARQKGDTTEISAAGLKVNPDATAEDLLKKAPGITVENGQVTAQGEQVQRVTIDGRQYFGDDATAALRNLPAELIDKVQVFDRLSDQAQLTGFSDGSETKALNIVTKANMRNGQFGRIYAGYGTDERYAAGTSMNFFKKDTRFNLVALFNNINQQNFSGEDLLGISGTANQGNRGGGGGRPGGGGGRPGGMGGFGGGGNNFFVGQQPGIATTNAVGLNYSDLWLKKKMEVSGSYFFNNSNTTARSETSRELFLPGDTSQFYNEERLSESDNYNHRFNFRAEYKIDSNNTLIYQPSFSYQRNNSVNKVISANTTDDEAFINSSINNRSSDGDSYNLRNDLTYRHAFKAKRGRSVSVNFNNTLNERNSDAFLDAITSYVKTGNLASDTLRQLTDNYTKSSNTSVNLAYTEPVGKKGQLQLNYNPQFTKSNTDQRNFLYDKTDEQYDIPDTSLSNVFDNIVRVQNAGITYRIGDRDQQLSFGVNFQNTKLESDQVFPQVGSIDKTYNNWLPNIQWRKNLSKQTNIRLNYRASVNVPSVNQLQNVYNISNPLFITSGNPQLDRSYTNFITARINSTNTQKGRNLFGGIFAQAVSKYVTNGTWVASKDSMLTDKIVLRKGAQYSKPINLDGYYSVRSFFTYGFPVKAVKSNLNLNLGMNYVRTPGLVNDVANFSNSYTYTAGFNLGSNISERIDFNVSYNGNFNQVINTIQESLNNKFYYHVIGLRVNLLTKDGWFVLNDLSNQIYSGLADGFNQDFWLWNVSAGKKFLKNRRGELKVSVFDLLKQNQSITRNVGETYIEDVQTQVLQQYFMLTFTYTLRNFGKQAAQGRQPARPAAR